MIAKLLAAAGGLEGLGLQLSNDEKHGAWEATYESISDEEAWAAGLVSIVDFGMRLAASQRSSKTEAL
jgi:hypothetical protein